MIIDCGKNVKMHFAFILRGTMLIGSPPDEPGRCSGWWSANETQHPVALTRD
jgi:hypothetical protein